MLKFLTDYINQQPKQMIPYDEYMNLVLYHPEYGYYMKEEEKIGRSGDFITTSNISDIFGGVIANWFAQQIKDRNVFPSFCEIGAGNGRFARAFLEKWNDGGHPEMTYYIIEKSPFHLKLLKDQLASFHQVRFISGLDELQEYNGFVFSNELFDALPVRVVKNENGSLYEMMVSVQNEELTEKQVPVENNELIQFINEYQVDIPDGHKIEIPIHMEEIVSQLGRAINNGILVTIDYGYTNEEWQEPMRRDGSLRGYYKHKLINNVLLHPGKMDITTHIHWDILSKMGEKHGFRTIKKCEQSEFLLSIGILNELENHFDANPFSEVSKRNRAIKSLVMPGGISNAFDVLIQEKGIIE